MTFAEIKHKLGEYLAHPSFEEIMNDANELIRNFQSLVEKRPVKAEAPDADAHDEEEDLMEEIRGLVKSFRERREEQRKERTEVEKKNLKEKQDILKEITRVISEEENISKAYTQFNELKDKWRSIGNVPFDKQYDIQKEFSRLSELFYYNMNIYKELRENDLKKNTGSKQDLIDRLKDLANKGNMRDLDQGLRSIQREWDNTGAVLKEKWEEIRNIYWDLVKQVEEKLESLRKEREQKQEEFLQQKRELVNKATAIKEREKQGQKDWDKATDELLVIQSEWKKIGFASREENEKIWNEFRTVCDAFFNEKKEFFGEMKSVYEENKKKKQDIIEKAEALKDSNDWKEAGNKLIQLQKEWQKIGSAGKKAEHPLWLQFRSACDSFFNRKKEHFAAADLALDENLRKKESFIASLASMEITGTDEEKIERLNSLGKEFNAIGDVPLKERERISKAFRAAMEDLSSRIQVDPSTRETTMFKARIAALSSQDNSEYLLSKERGIIRDRINKINEEIIRIENNMAFFGNSKNASDMLKEYQEKIESLKKEIETQKEKLKLFPKANKA
jgi:DNA repair exonuclease SbcCD ATPase subunit